MYTTITSTHSCGILLLVQAHLKMPCIYTSIKIKMCSFNISVYGRKQTDRQTDRQTYRHTYIHTHMCNAVTLVWGSLRLAPIIVYIINDCIILLLGISCLRGYHIFATLCHSYCKMFLSSKGGIKKLQTVCKISQHITCHGRWKRSQVTIDRADLTSNMNYHLFT